MLNNTELENLVECISHYEIPLENCYSQIFSKQFTYDQFRPCFVLSNLIEENVLTREQKYIAYFLIHEAFVEKINPFSPFLIDICQNTSSSFEKKFLYDLLMKNFNKEFLSQNIKSILEEEEIFNEEIQLKEDFEEIKNQVYENMPKLSGLKEYEIHGIIPDFNMDENRNMTPEVGITSEKITQYDQSTSGFSLDFIRPIPGSIILNDEPIWLNPGIIIDVGWDSLMCRDSNSLSIVKELIHKSHISQLTFQESKILLDAFENESKLVLNCGITPQMLPELVEKNSNIASTVLIKLMESSKCSEYLETLVKTELTLSSLEVVNKLANEVELPKEFLTLYISNCIMCCEQKQKDKNIQNRLVRLVCVFIKSLIKNKIINPKEMYIELQAFCVDFSKISEASSLFKMLKSLDSSKNENN